MNRPLGLLLSMLVMLAVAPGAEANQRVKRSDVLACAALQGAPCQARLKTRSDSIVRPTLLKEMRTWNARS